MAITLKEETVLNDWTMLIEDGAGRGQELLRDIERRLQASRIPGECTWEIEEVQSAGLFSKVRREFLIVRLRQFPDYRTYIAARDYGIHLDVCRFVTVEPSFFKKAIASKLADGDWAAFSAPKNILVEQDLSAWVTVVHHVVRGAVQSLVKSLGQDPAGVRRETKGFLQVW